MAKDKSKKNKGKKSEAKKVGGIKIPKPLRKAGKEALKLASEPVVSEIVAAALLSAASALRGDKAAAKAGKGAAAPGKAAGDAAAEMGRHASKIGDSLRDLALDLARRTLDNWERATPAAGASTKVKKAGGKSGQGPSRP